MKKSLNRRVVYILALALANGMALLQVGCLEEGPGSEHLSKGQIDSAATRFGPDEPGVKELADKVTWISVMKPPLAEKTPKVLDVLNGSQANLAPVQIWRQNGNAQQNWDIAPVGSFGSLTTYVFINQHSGKCLDMKNDGPVGDGTVVQQYDCLYNANQIWAAERVVTDSTDPTYKWVKLFNMQRVDLCLDVKDVNYSDGARLQVWTCSGHWNQRWNIF